jgi:hypothetical protein
MSDSGDTFLLAEVLRPLRPASEHDNPIAPAFSGCLPTYDRAGQLCEKCLTAFLTQHDCCGRRSQAELLVRAAPAGLAGEAKARGQITEPSTAHAVAGLPDGRGVCLARAQRLRPAQFLAECGEFRERFPTDDQLSAEISNRLVTRTSGESRSTVVRRARDKSFRGAITGPADNSSNTTARTHRAGQTAPHAASAAGPGWPCGMPWSSG